MKSKDGLQPPWQKGVSGNPAGRPPNLINKQRIRKAVSELLAMKRSEVLSIAKGDDQDMLYQVLAMTLLKAYQSGDIKRLDAMFDRAVGRVKDEVEHTAKAFIYRRPNGDEIVSGIGDEDGVVLDA